MPGLGLCVLQIVQHAHDGGAVGIMVDVVTKPGRSQSSRANDERQVYSVAHRAWLSCDRVRHSLIHVNAAASRGAQRRASGDLPPLGRPAGPVGFRVFLLSDGRRGRFLIHVSVNSAGPASFMAAGHRP